MTSNHHHKHPHVRIYGGKHHPHEQRDDSREIPTPIEGTFRQEPLGLIQNVGKDEAQPIGRSFDFESRIETGGIVGIAIGSSICLLSLLLFLCNFMRTKMRKSKESDTLFAIFPYLMKFNLEDFDIKMSPTGGFHVEFVNDLADGRCASDEEEFLKD